MARYLVQASYTAAAWAAMVERPEDRSLAVRRMVQNAGGHLECFYLAFGDHDVVTIIDVPDNVAAAAVSMAAAAGGGLRGVRTTPLLTTEDAVDALGRARTVEYAAPGEPAEVHTPIPAG
jgi:uncharacterized protein with GYD domain